MTDKTFNLSKNISAALDRIAVTTNPRDLVSVVYYPENLDFHRIALSKKLNEASEVDREIGSVLMSIENAVDAEKYQSLTETLNHLEKRSDFLRKAIVSLTRKIGVLEYKESVVRSSI